MTIFLFISGYVTEKQLIRNGKEYVGGSFFKKKAVRLYVPYIQCVLFFAIVGRHGLIRTLYELLNIKGDWFLSAISIFLVLFVVANQIMFRIRLNFLAGGGIVVPDRYTIYCSMPDIRASFCMV